MGCDLIIDGHLHHVGLVVGGLDAGQAVVLFLALTLSLGHAGQGAVVQHLDGFVGQIHVVGRVLNVQGHAGGFWNWARVGCGV